MSAKRENSRKRKPDAEAELPPAATPVVAAPVAAAANVASAADESVDEDPFTSNAANSKNTMSSNQAPEYMQLMGMLQALGGEVANLVEPSGGCGRFNGTSREDSVSGPSFGAGSRY